MDLSLLRPEIADFDNIIAMNVVSVLLSRCRHLEVEVFTDWYDKLLNSLMMHLNPLKLTRLPLSRKCRMLMPKKRPKKKPDRFT
jgi:hypothetical protein